MGRKCKFTKTGVCNDCLEDYTGMHVSFFGRREACTRASYMKLKESGQWAGLVRISISEQIKRESRKVSKTPRRPMYKVDEKGLIQLDFEEFMRREAWKD